ncbi:MAG: hypothetical protein JWQ09_5377, partial [Segetibacter sp.]|nr:hypothetical protein [Segetibacter sp.]
GIARLSNSLIWVLTALLIYVDIIVDVIKEAFRYFINYALDFCVTGFRNTPFTSIAACPVKLAGSHSCAKAPFFNFFQNWLPKQSIQFLIKEQLTSNTVYGLGESPYLENC